MELELLVMDGPLKDQRFGITVSGLRLGRSSSCEISIPDPALSRNHCLFELRDGVLWLTDLASANGTVVNGEQLGAQSKRLEKGDRVQAGETLLAVVEPGCAASAPTPPARALPMPGTIDLGLHAGRQVEEVGEAKPSPRHLILWAVALVAVSLAVVVILSKDEAAQEPAVQPVAQNEKPSVRTFSFEKVEADGNGIYRYALSYGEDATMSVEIDDVPKENRHVRKSVRLESAARARLDEMFSSPNLCQLDSEYAGVPLRQGALKSFTLRVVRDDRVFDVSIENAPEPDAFRELRERLETFSKNELGIWAIQFSAEKLLEMSAESRRAGDAKWDERDVRHGNLAMALASYREAVFYLETVNPKPADHGALVKRCEEVEAELDRRYRDQRFLADKAINLADWETALRELRVLCELVPDPKDARHAEASAKLLDVEARIKKGGRK